MADETLMRIANRLVANCREGKEVQGLDELYADDAVSIEATVMSGTDSPEAAGLEAIRGKHAWWESAMEMHSSSVEGPFPHGSDRFAVIFSIDATNRQNQQRMEMREVGIYTVKDGKIVREEFFYAH